MSTPSSAAHSTPETPSPPFGWVLAGLSLCVLLPSLGVSIASVGLPAIAGAFAIQVQDVKWVVVAYLLAICTLVVGVGRLGDLVGRRRLLFAGVALFAGASAACAAATTPGLLIAGRAVQGLGAAIMMVLAMAIAGSVVPTSRLGTAMGLLGTMSAIGTALGPALGGLLISALDWPAIFLAQAVLGVLAMVIVGRTPDQGGPRPSARFDAAGTALLGLGLAGIAFALTPGGHGFGLLQALSAGAGAAILACFAFVQSRSATPLLRWSLLRGPGIGLGAGLGLLAMAAIMSTLVAGPFYLIAAFGLDAAAVGLVMTVGPLVAALVGLPAGRFVDRVGPRRVVIGGLAAMAAGLAALPAVPIGWGIAGYIAPLTVVTAGFAMFQAANNAAVIALAPDDQRGVVSGLLNLSRSLGLMGGASLMAALLALGSASVRVADGDPMLAGGRTAFRAAAALAGLAAALAWASRAPAPAGCQPPRARFQATQSA